MFAEFYPVSFIRIRVEAQQGVYRHHGTVGSVPVDYLIPTEKLLFSIGLRFNIDDARFARKYFGVSPAEAALNGRVPSSNPASFYSAGVLSAVTTRRARPGPTLPTLATPASWAPPKTAPGAPI